MSCHGFGGGKVRSDTEAPEEVKMEIANRIVAIPYIEWAWPVKPHDTSLCHYDIIFKFKRLGKPPFTKINHDHLVNEIKTISVNGHRVEHVDLWILQED